MLEHALDDLLTKKPFEKISVGDIADAATLNRATFYAHFADKFDLLEATVATRFQDLLQSRGVTFDGNCPSAIYGITLAVCDFLANMPYCSEQRQLAQHLELAMVAIVRSMIGSGLSQRAQNPAADFEMIAAALAGAIYGAAKQWIRTKGRPDAEETAAMVTRLLGPMMAHPQ